MTIYTRFDIDALDTEFGFFEGTRCRAILYVPAELSTEAGSERAAAIALLRRATAELEATAATSTEWPAEAMPA